MTRAMIALAERCEGASGPDERWTLLNEAADLILGTEASGPRARFGFLMDVEAYENAALLLVPEGWYIGEWAESPDRDTSWITLVPAADETTERTGKADTPALALTAAALRAHAAKEGK